MAITLEEVVPSWRDLSGPRWTGVLRKLALQDLRKAHGLLEAMLQRRVESNAIHFCTVLSASDAQGDWPLAVELLGRMHDLELPVDARASNNAISACAKRRHWQRSLEILEQALDSRLADVVSFGAALSGGAPSTALLQQMEMERIKPNTICYNAAIASCEDWAMALQLFSDMYSAELQPDLRSCNSVLKKISRFEALNFMETMKQKKITPDEISYNTAIHNSPWDAALHMLRDMRSEELRLNVVAVSSAMNACQMVSEWPYALAIFQHMQDQSVGPDKIAWSALFNACDKGGQWQLILQFLGNSEYKDLDSQSLSIAMNGLTRQRRWQDALQMFWQVDLTGEVDLHCYTALVHACGQGKQWQCACSVLDEVSRPDIAIFNAVMGGMCGWQDAIGLLHRMQEASCQPNLVTFKSMAGHGWQLASWISEAMLSESLEADVNFKQSLAQKASRASILPLSHPMEVDYEKMMRDFKAEGAWESALSVLHELCMARFSPSLAMFNSLIHSCEKVGCWESALATVAWMKGASLDPLSRVTLNSAISACEKGRRWRWALHLFQELGDAADEVSYNAAISAMEKSGQWQLSLLLLDHMLAKANSVIGLSPDEVTFNAAISVCAKEDQWTAAVWLFDTMQRLKVCPDEITYNCLASACESEQWQLSLFFLLHNEATLQALCEGSEVTTPTECAQVLWRLAKMRRMGVDPQALARAARWATAMADVKEFDLQELISSLWSLSSLGVAGHPLLAELRSRGRQRAELQRLGSRHLAMLGKVLAETGENMADELHSVLREMARRLDSLDVHSMSEAALSELGSVALSLMYACHFSDHSLSPGEASLARELRRALGGLGALFDGRCRRKFLAPCLHADLATGSSPRVVLQDPDVLVLWKPPHWQVDEREPRETEDVDDRGLLSSFVQAMVPRPLVFNEAHQRGFLHRLDVPSSGLILIAQSFEAFYDLKFQLSTGLLERDYTVLCHGHMPQSRSMIQSRIAWTSQGPSANEVSSIDDAGRASKTLVVRHRHVPRASRFSLLEIRICTGRRHQIRVHTSYVGHPTVMDGKYTSLPTQQQDSQWCPRNFLHRHRLAFQRAAEPTEVFEALPEDLAQALRHLHELC